ncbi:LysR family transcriptional regulator [Paenibacillus sp. SC116]|uniref:LysR family transcriptional regulator n=1 Tax=Paenibacillus sp. SC116 TaxID=2968986 RepID=UPI00215A25CA|nr:LysR family transcriptional regulator [Paenibacillus sp. SC116]MCR8842097.1 LysR family transcriptional regulator [Paenibacillus sp. SC116]
MEIRLLQTFQAVVQYGSQIKAANLLQYAQSTITLHINQLEETLGIKLFERQGKQMVLTEAGRLMKEQADILLNQVDVITETAKEFSIGQKGLIRIGAIDSIGIGKTNLISVLTTFMKEHPQICLSIESGVTQQFSQRIIANELDIALCPPPSPELNLEFYPLYEEKLCLILPIDHPLSTQEKINMCDLEDENFILTGQLCEYRRKTEQVFLHQGVHLHSKYDAANIEMVLNLVRQGFGIAMLPSNFVANSHQYAIRDIDDISFALPVGLMRKKNKVLSPATEKLIANLFSSC